MKTILSMALFLLLLSPVYAQQTGKLHGVVEDPLGNVVTHASVELLRDQQVVSTVTSDAEGRYDFTVSASGRYSVRASAPTFSTARVCARTD